MEQLTKKQILASRIILCVLLLLCGLFFLVAAFTPLQIKKLILPATLGYVGLSMFALSFVQKNTLFLWLSPLFIIAATVSALAAFTALKYGQMYPLYILSPAIGSVITAIYSKEYSFHLKVIIAFAPLSGIFLLHSIARQSLAIVAPMAIIYFSVVLTAYSIKKAKND